MSEYSFNSGFIKRISPSENEKNVLKAYHYTSPGAFLSIVKDGFIRFSDIDYMNDRSETVYAVKVLLDFLDNNPGKYLFTEDVVGCLIGENNFEDIKKLKVTNVVFKDFPNLQYQKQRNFLFCLSTKPDSLNMWNYYVQNGRYEGYSIGFDTYEFLKTFDTPSAKELNPFQVYYGKVIYKEESQHEAIRRIVEAIERYSQHRMNPILPFASTILRNKLGSEGLFIKHPEFSSEQEYRVVIHIADERIPHNTQEAKKYSGENNKEIYEDFCVKNGLIVPFLKVKIPEDSIIKTVVSPITEFAIAEQGIGELLKVGGFTKAVIEHSKIPIRF